MKYLFNLFALVLLLQKLRCTIAVFLGSTTMARTSLMHKLIWSLTLAIANVQPSVADARPQAERALREAEMLEKQHVRNECELNQQYSKGVHRRE